MLLIILILLALLIILALAIIVVAYMVLNVDICAREHEEIFYDNELDM